jgi:hypothetical protein
MGGRLTLVNSVSEALLLYFLSLYHAPDKVINHLEKLRRQFLEGGNSDKKDPCY